MDLEKSEPKYWSQLHTRIINKDPDAYLELYDFLCSKMKRVLFTRPNIDYQRIEDYIQDTFLAVIESANTVRFSQKFGAFIYQIAIRQQGSKYGRRLTEFDLKTIFNFDFDKLSQDDAYFLLCLGEQSFWPMVDTNKYKFSFIEAFDIMKAYQFNRSVVTDLNYKVLKSYQIAEVFIITGEEFLDLFDTDVLTTLDWLNVLVYQPKFIYKCDFDKFLRGDPFNLIQLIVLFDSPDLSYLIDQIDKNKITAFGWERLLIGKPDRFKDICDYKKLNEANWLVISQEAPELLSYKP